LYIWTSDLYGASAAWVVHFVSGYCCRYDVELYHYHARAVRSVRSQKQERYKLITKENPSAYCNAEGEEILQRYEDEYESI
jgi:hypothetical protein